MRLASRHRARYDEAVAQPRSRSERPAPAGNDSLPNPATTPTGRAPSARPSNAAPKKKKGRRGVGWWAKWIALSGGVLFAIGFVALAIFIRRVEAGLPSVSELRKGYRPPQVTRIVASDGTELAELFTERRTLVHVQDLPPHVKLAVLAAEDAGFYEHHGLDYLGIARAVWVNLRHGKTKQGASTITQQVVKNLLLDPERTYMRKIREALLARRIEQELTKDEILELYLNHIYFGGGRYGIEEAARYYFGKHAKELTVPEAALLAGLPAAPELFNPRKDMAAATRRRKYVLDQLFAKQWITAAEHDAAIVEPVKLAPIVEANDDVAPEVVDYVRDLLEKTVGSDAARRGGYTVETAIDRRLQLAARASVREATSAYDKRWKLIGPFLPYPSDGKDPKTHKKLSPQEKPFEGTPRFGHGDVYVGVVVGLDDASRTLDVDVGSVRGVVKLEEHDRYDPNDLPPSAWAAIGTRLRVSLLAPPPSATPNADAGPTTGGDAGAGAGADLRVPLRLELGPEAAFVALDVRTRHVLALVGNVEAAAGGLDRALQAHRQPGSTFKPFVYGAAIASKKMTPATVIEATPGEFGGYNPKNFEAWTKTEPVRMREALANSINLVAVRVTSEVGPQSVIDFARAAGISSDLKPDLAIALGSYEVTPIELATAYATFADGGQFDDWSIVVRIVGPDGKEVPLPPRRPSARAMGEPEAYVLTSMMTSVVDHGTASSAKVLARPIAGKTGTSNLAKDTWFAGFDPELVAVAWVGFDDAKPLGYGEMGARTALPAWISFMKEATKGKPKVEFPRPAGVVTVKIDPKTGKLPYEGETDAIDEVFLQGTDPTEVSTPEPVGDEGVADGGVGAGDAALVVAPSEAPENPWGDASP